MNEVAPAPFLSMLVISGDSGLLTLPRLLRSALFRPDGALIDEVVLGWNGKDDGALKTVLREFGTVELPDAAPGSMGLVPEMCIRILRQEWKGDFALARNEVMAKCRGEFIVWSDADDIIACAADEEGPDGLKAIQAVERTYGLEVPEGAPAQGQTLKTWLKSLPWSVNCILAPYDYAILADGSVTIRQVMKRVLRRSSQWVWRSVSGIHELPYPAGAEGERSLFTAGLLNRHYPAQEAQDRLTRNRDIIKKAEGRPEVQQFADARHAYDICTMHIATADMVSADAAIQKAIERSNNDEDTFRYRLVRYSILATLGRLHEALQEALRCIGLYADRCDGYFAVAEAFYLLGKYRACIRYYELGAACPVVPTSLDLVVNRIVRPRANAAWSYCEVGEPERAVPIAVEALREYPNDALAQRAFQRAKDDTERKRSMEGVLEVAEYLLARGDAGTAQRILYAANTTPLLRGIGRGMRFRSIDANVRRRLSESSKVQLPPEVKRQLLQSAPEGAELLFVPKEAQPTDVEFFHAAMSARSEQLLAVKELPEGNVAIVRRTDKPKVTFYCPAGNFLWNPTYPEVHGLGGSESAFIFLGRELAKRGYPVVMYCNDGGNSGNVDRGITWFGLPAFDDTANHGILISCRAPWIVRNPEVNGRGRNPNNPVYTWHQDNGYGNEWSWNSKVVERLTGNLHVSSWARDGLVRELGGTTIDDAALQKHHVIGNGVQPEWVWALREKSARPARHPYRVIFASDPMRGLETLLNMWPHVLKKVPDAELHVYSDFGLAMVLMGVGIEGGNPAARSIIDRAQAKLRNTPNVVWHGRVSQPALSAAMMEASIYAYPGGPMPEGFGVSLAQAAAAGMAVLFPDAGALPEVLPGKSYMTPPVQSEEAAQQFLERLIGAVESGGDVDREQQSRAVWAQHRWEAVTDRFEAVLKQDGLI